MPEKPLSAGCVSREVARLVSEFPLGTLVWHRASGRRSVIVGYELLVSGVRLKLDYGNGAYDHDFPFCVSATKVNIDADWQEPA